MKQKKLLLSILLFLTITLSSCQSLATNLLNNFGKINISESYLEYLELEDKENVIAPRAYEIPKSKVTITNPLRLTRMVGSSSNSLFSLKNLIPENMVVKSQQTTNSCWTFSSLAALESNLALKDYKNGIATPIVYDFSERHMEYATSKTFKDNVINPIGFNREVGAGGSYSLSLAYLTNGTGAIDESQMPFENNEDKIYISEIQNKDVKTQVNDAVIFPSYNSTDDKTLIIKQMKEHIKNYGAIDACIHGAMIDLNSKVYNNSTGAIYCNNSTNYPLNHGVAIIGWDDNYSVDNFVATNKPQNNGAWIIKNSWGTEVMRFSLADAKQFLYNNYHSEFTSASVITNQDILQKGFKIDENNEVYMPIGDKGFMYVSYEDANIYRQLSGIIDAQGEKAYENIYQYNEYGAPLLLQEIQTSKIYFATEFDRKSSGTEYLTQVAINTPETYTCKVYVNTNGNSLKENDLVQVKLKTGENETIDAGYHTIEFAEPIKINSDKFVVVIEARGEKNQMSLSIETNLGAIVGTKTEFDNVKISDSKCFIATESKLADCEWLDTSEFHSTTGGAIPNFDTTIKAFTTSNVLENIQITTPPTKTNYVVGQDFNKAGMIVKANYANGKSIEITDYTIQNGTNLALNQKEVTIVYENKTTTQQINVEENTIQSVEIKTPPTKTEYYAGEDFDTTGMVIEAIYKDGTRKAITDYNILDGQTLKNGQTTVKISAEEKTATQAITVHANNVVKIEITKVPNKVNYVAGQSFDPTGMVVMASYENGMNKEVTDYEVQDGSDLKLGQTEVTISYEDKTATQAITVIEKVITGITVKTMPTKVEYIQNKEELDLTGGVLEVAYNDGAKEDVLMTSEDVTVTGFNNEELGKQNLTVTYKNQTTQFEVEIKELPKPQNSKFDDLKGNVTSVRAYSYTDKNKKEHAILNIELSNIVIATDNEKMEYYYYLSSNPNEENITDWVQIKEVKNVDGKIQFEINTSDLKNYEELILAKTIHLYVKEVATRNEMKVEKVSESLKLEVENIKIEHYLDDIKKEEVLSGTVTDNTPAQKEDDTKAPGSIPKAGHDLLMICLAIAIITIGKIAYSKYKDIELK